ncbi:MAG TPA: potassium channel family protein [Nocardioides sp.]|uniref:potassium channel family protein n=1 Tax=uncultured Nocardioides sp. TaxID=198441 RepID=UPI0026031229|nr:potassium channel family protein [uncultured Nocardioides sp.]HRD59993.1 potassium channel family protein [Nocardioides sp.]HRI94573.1 potassium channel family protein [Nocardioides sp.]
MIAVLVLTLYFTVPVESDPRGGPLLRAFLATTVLALLAAAVVLQVRLSIDNEDRHLDGLIVAILMVWIVFSMAFYILADHQPHQVSGLHTKLDSLYFAATTMLTIGYGDIHAEGQLARGMVLVQMLFDVVFVAIAVGTLTTQMRNRVSRNQALKGRRDTK